jgi:trk system potassium uptake protein TrkA
MKIIIAGAGEVGSHLAKMLSRQKHTITLIDEDEEKLQQLESDYDLIGVTGATTSIITQKEAGIASTDLFVAVTPYESQNITACILAKQLGAHKTVARINNHEYLLPANKEFFERLGIHALIYPEMLAAKEVANSLEINWVRQWIDFQDGALTLIGLKVRNEAPILHQKLADLTDSAGYRIVAIRRKSETIIPTGNDEIMPNDIAYFITTKEYIEHVRTQAGKEVVNIKDLMIMGGGRMTVKSVQTLPHSMNVKVLERNKDKAFRLVEQLPNAMIILGDASNLDLLKQENIDSMDAFVALTENSEANILACIAAKKFGIRKTIAEVENFDYIQFAESLDIGTIINKKQIAADYIYQYTLDIDVNNVKNITYVNTDVVELIAKEGAKITKDIIKNLRLPKGFFIGGIIRNGKGYIANGDTHIQPNDNVIVFYPTETMYKIEKWFS